MEAKIKNYESQLLQNDKDYKILNDKYHTILEGNGFLNAMVNELKEKLSHYDRCRGADGRFIKSNQN